MNLNIPPNKIYPQSQSVVFNGNLTTLIGGNGSGKSAILEAIFKEQIYEDGFKVICFSTGQNESFSKIYKKFLEYAKRELIERVWEESDSSDEQAINSFYFDVSWTRLILFFSAALKKGLLHKFLLDKGFSILDNDSNDASTELSFSFRIPIEYARKIQQIQNREAREFEVRSIRRTVAHQKTHAFINGVIDSEYDFETSITKGVHKLKAFDVPRILDTNVDEIFTFLWYVANMDFLNLEDCELHLNGGLEINDLSDGEFVLLTIYALLDLFDSEKTLFIFDEVDSHLYFENNSRLWTELKKAKGHVLTTTHSADSILFNSFEGINLVKNGQLELNDSNKANLLLNRISTLTQADTYKFRISAKLEYIALVEDSFDWYVFKKLCERKIPNFNRAKIEKIFPVKCADGYDSSHQTFGKNRIEWVANLNQFSTKQTLSVKSIFLICDKDEFNINDIFGVRVTQGSSGQRPNEFKLCNDDSRKGYLLSWRRREIENYFLSYKLLNYFELLEPVHQRISPQYHLRPDSAGDNEGVQNADIKEIVQELYLRNNLRSLKEGDRGIDYSSVDEIINYMPISEISEDIEKMYQFIIGKID